MINSVSSVSFRSAVPQYNDPFARPGRYAKPETIPQEEAPKKNHKALKWILGIAATAVAAGALLVVGKNKNWFKVFDKAESLQNAGFMSKCSHYLGKAAEFVDTKCWQPLKGKTPLFPTRN